MSGPYDDPAARAWAHAQDPEPEDWERCSDECPEDCQADHRGEE